MDDDPGEGACTKTSLEYADGWQCTMDNYDYGEDVTISSEGIAILFHRLSNCQTVIMQKKITIYSKNQVMVRVTFSR